MNRGSKSRSGKVLLEEGPNHENQSPHSPATSSNTPPLPRLNVQRIERDTRCYLPEFVKGEDGPETRVTTRPNPNNGGYQFRTSPRANRSRKYAGPHLSPSLQPRYQPRSQYNREFNLRLESTYLKSRTPESHADLFVAVGADLSTRVGSFSASPLANYNFIEELLHSKSLKTLEPKKEKFLKNVSF